MRRPILKRILPSLALGAILVAAPAARAQIFYAPVVSPPVTYSYYPTTTYYAPAPVVSYYPQPTFSAYAPVRHSYFAAPSVSYYQPAVAYSAPVVAYSAPAVAFAPGSYTTRSYVGYGIFRPRGVYTQSYYTPYAAPTTSFYRPILWR